MEELGCNAVMNVYDNNIDVSEFDGIYKLINKRVDVIAGNDEQHCIALFNESYTGDNFSYDFIDFFGAKKKGFEIFKQGVTAAVRCAQIGSEGQAGLDRCKAEIDRRLAK